ncbi:MAG: flagellar protein FlbB [Treponemataceae bacterium]
MAKRGTIGKVIVLILLIIVLIFASLFLFDYLGLINIKPIFSPVYSLFGIEKPQGVSKETPLSGPGDLDADMLNKRLEAFEIRRQELDKKETDVLALIAENEQISAELEERQAAQEEKEKSFQQMLAEKHDRAANIRQIAIYAYNSRPDDAVKNLLELDDQDIIEILRAAEVYSKELGKNSPVSYWFTLMPPERAGEIQRKMANAPSLTQ